MPNLETLTTFVFGLTAGVGLALAYLHLVEALARRERQSVATTPAKPWNELQRAVYDPKDAPRPADHPAAETPGKRGPGRPRKMPGTPARIVGGTRATRTWVEPEVDAKKRERRKIN